MQSGTKIPKRDVVAFVVRDVMKKYREVGSLAELTALVNKNLKEVDPKLSISTRRLKILLPEIEGMKIVVETKRSGKTMKRCPVCGYSLQKVYTKNLEGKKILYKLKCERCGYEGVDGKWMPRRYKFFMKYETIDT